MSIYHVLIYPKEGKLLNKPLTQPMFYILLSLKEKRHGYEIMQYIEWLTEGKVQVGPGTLYSLLPRFEKDKYIEMISEEDKKKTYLITDLGRDVLNGEIQRFEAMIGHANYVKEGKEDEFQNRN